MTGNWRVRHGWLADEPWWHVVLSWWGTWFVFVVIAYFAIVAIAEVAAGNW